MLSFSKLLEFQQELVAKNTPHAVVTIYKAQGSTPRSNGKMIVLKDKTIRGTVGGGASEYFAVEEAVKSLDPAFSEYGKPRMIRYEIGRKPLPKTASEEEKAKEKSEEGDHMCGGRVEFFIEPFIAAKRLILIGGGHVNQEIGKLAASVGFYIELLETRPEIGNEKNFPFAKKITIGASYDTLVQEAGITSDCAVVLATHNKDGTLKERLAKEGSFTNDDFAKWYTPIGLDIGSETPEEIAISVVAEIYKVMNKCSGLSLRERRDDFVIVRGSGDLATGVIVRLVKSGFRVLALDISQPSAIRRTVAFAQAFFEDNKTCTVEGVTAKVTTNVPEAMTLMENRMVPLMADPAGRMIRALEPLVVVDAIIAKRNIGTQIDMAPLVIGLGPGFTPGTDCHCAVETNRGHGLGRVLVHRAPDADTGVPGLIAGKGVERVLRATAEGEFVPMKVIGDIVEAGDVCGMVGEEPVKTTIAGVVRGMLAKGLHVTKGFKVADVDPRKETNVYEISDKARTISGGVLEAIMRYKNGRLDW